MRLLAIGFLLFASGLYARFLWKGLRAVLCTAGFVLAVLGAAYLCQM
jgi:hypothetical protein